MTRSAQAFWLAVVVTLALPGAASASVLTTGTLTNAAGTPTAGNVTVYAWVFPKRGQTMEMPRLGSATADASGRFSVSTLNDSLLRTLSTPRGGWVDFMVVGNAGGYSGTWGFTGFVDAPGGVARVSTADAIIQGASGARAASSNSRVPDVRVRALVPTVSARASQAGRCDTRHHVRAVGSMRKLTIVGELNNAYNDGTEAHFNYGRGKSAETTIGAASQAPDGSWAISAEYLVSNSSSGEAEFPSAKRRWSRKLRSLFEYTKYEMQSSSCAVWEPHIRATSWIGDIDDSVKQDGLDKCDPKYLSGWPSGGRWFRHAENAVRFTRAVEAYGVNLTARSGYSNQVTLAFRWRGPSGKKHYICGEDGKSSAYESGRVFTGSRK